MAGKLARSEDGTELHVTLTGVRGFEFMNAKDQIKDIPGRRWNPDMKVWVMEATVENAQRLITTIKPEVEPDVMDWIRESRQEADVQLVTQLPDDADLVLPWARQRTFWQPESVNDVPFTGLFDYQRSFVDLAAKNRKVLLADDMGLGKTLQAISAVEEYSLRNGMIQGPKLIVAPKSVKGSWLREIRRWLPDDTPAAIIEASSAAKRRKLLEETIEANGWAIVNWEQLRVENVSRRVKRRDGSEVTKRSIEMKEPLFASTEWLAVIADEVHRAKNRKAKQTQGLWRCQGQLMLGLSGTPLMNSPDELWAILRWLYPEQYHESGRDGRVAFWKFYTMYCDFYEGSFGKVITGVKNPDGLRFELNGRLVRRTASLLGLKGRKRIYYDLDLNPGQKKLYDKAEDELLLEITKAAQEGDQSAARMAKAIAEGVDSTTLLKIPNGASRLLRLQQILETPATLGAEDDSALMDDCVEKILDSQPNQWVVGTKFKISAEVLADRLRSVGLEVGLYTGDVSSTDRTKMEDEFQAGNIDVIVGTMAALKEGITLTAAHLMYEMTPDFVPATNEQFEARCDRLGQQEMVRVYRPQPLGCVTSTKVEPMLNLKERIIRTVLPKIDIDREFE